MPSGHPLLIAHRGESRDAPENTLAAFRLAWERGARAVELDVRRTADDAAVVIHDADLRRVGRSPLVVAETAVAALRTVDIGSWKHRRWAGERVPLLAEALASVPRGARVFVEIKCGPEIVPAIGRALAASRFAPEKVVVMSFREETVARAAAELRGCEACLLRTVRQWCADGGLDAAITTARELGCTSLDVQVHRRLDRAAAARVHDAGLRLYTWTVNRAATARRLVRAGLDGITTDRCAWMSGLLTERVDDGL